MIHAPPGGKPTQVQAVADQKLELAVTGRSFWARNGFAVYGVIVIGLLAIAGREAWSYFSSFRESKVKADFAKVDSSSPEQLGKFAADNNGHPLAGLAFLLAADSQYTVGNYQAAQGSYEKAAFELKDAIVKTRARLGAAMSQLASGDQAGGSAVLQKLVDDAGAEKVFRVEAAYELAVLAKDAGKMDDLKKLADQASKIDPTSIWTKETFVLITQMPIGQHQK